MQPLVLHLRSVLADLVKKLRIAHVLTLEENGPDVYEKVIASDLAKFEELTACKNFLELYEKLTAVTYDRLPSSRGFSGDAGKLSRVKELRDQVKDTVKKINKQYFFASPEVMCGQVRRAEPMAKELVRLAIAFSEAFAAEKRRKNLVDFHDLEHFALEILVDAKTKQARAAAEEFRDMYEEIMIDEYQDSNHVQETLLRAISREERGAYNLFMVGDVKQSIYRFRLARPELFMEKYDTYTLEESSTQRIDLHRNFRSRSEVLDLTNDVCYRIMARDLGNVAYDEDAALYAGADYCAPDEAGMFAPEILVADSAEELLEGSGYEDRKLYEAKLVAERIRKLMISQKVTDKATGELRAVRYSDIVILLRSLSGYADSFAAVLNEVEYRRIRCQRPAISRRWRCRRCLRCFGFLTIRDRIFRLRQCLSLRSPGLRTRSWDGLGRTTAACLSVSVCSHAAGNLRRVKNLWRKVMRKNCGSSGSCMRGCGRLCRTPRFTS